ncbi:NAD(P)H-binding protein [Bordetella petrii]|nr:NAD(P)H-binding protein [Bordetella petrii]
MNVLVLGASGFLGRHVVRVLADAGHAVVAGVRAVPAQEARNVTYRHVDFNRLGDADAWRPLLRDVDVVINAVGIFRESRGKQFRQLHEQAPRALFQACGQAGVRRVIQVSALGADAGAQTAYHLSKRAADEYLLSLPLDAVVVQPSLVYGAGGASAALFGMLATLPLMPAPALGAARLQPIHVDDVAAAMVALAGGARPSASRIALVGPRALSWREFLQGLRTALGMPGRGWFMPVPGTLAAAMARLGDRWRGALLDTAAWRMLRRGNSADVEPLRALLGRLPRDVTEFVAPDEAPAQRAQAQLRWLLPMARLSLAALWIVTGLVSLGIYPLASSYALLQRAGVPQALQPLALYGAAWLDIALGLLALAPRRMRWLWAIQAALILAYTGIISWRLPEFWLHPYGPILKNLPLLALLWLLYELDRPWNTR